MEYEFEERLARLERRVIANRAAITLLVGMLAKMVGEDAVHEAIIATGRQIPDDDGESFEEVKELFVTLATVAKNA